jgi:Family of unknown function (DUF6338)
VLTIARAAHPGLLPDPGKWLSQKEVYLQSHYRLIARTGVIEVMTALGLAWLADRILARRFKGHIVPGSTWFRVLKMDVPARKTPWVNLKLTDGTDIWGFLKYYSPQEKLENREIVLEHDNIGQQLAVRLPTDTEPNPQDTWKAIVVRGDQIRLMKVDYVAATAPESGLLSKAFTSIRHMLRRIW